MKSILFVCLGNICRSPAAEVILKHLVKERGVDLYIDSCALGTWNLGCPADSRMQLAIGKRGLSIKTRAKLFEESFYDVFDYILVAEEAMQEELLEKAPKEAKNKIHRISDFSKKWKGTNVPDPYYGGPDGFEHVLDMLFDCCEEFLEEIS